MTGTTLSTLRQMFKAEAGIELDETIASASDGAINRLLANTQLWLAPKFPGWLKARSNVSLTPGTQYYTYPASELDEQSIRGRQTVLWNSSRLTTEFGIRQQDYEISTAQLDPVMRWDLLNVSGVRKIEVWPIPATAHTLILEGTRPLSDFTSDANTCDLDDLCIVYFAAAKWCATQKRGNAAALLQQAQQRLAELLGHQPSRFETFILGGGVHSRAGRRPVIASGGGGGPVTADSMSITADRM